MQNIKPTTLINKVRKSNSTYFNAQEIKFFNSILHTIKKVGKNAYFAIESVTPDTDENRIYKVKRFIFSTDSVQIDTIDEHKEYSDSLLHFRMITI